MKKPYEPELGQAAFGQPWKEYEAPELLIAALSHIDNELDRVQFNVTQDRWQSPFCNTGNTFKCRTFHVCAYSWRDDEQPYNFKCGDIEVSWYKWLGRGTSVNRHVSNDEIAEMLDKCLTALRAYEKHEMAQRHGEGAE